MAFAWHGNFFCCGRCRYRHLARAASCGLTRRAKSTFSKNRARRLIVCLGALSKGDLDIRVYVPSPNVRGPLGDSNRRVFQRLRAEAN